MTTQPELLPETAGDFYTRMDCDGHKWAKELSDAFPSIPLKDAIGWCCSMVMQGYDRGYKNAKREDNPNWPITPSPATHTQGEVERVASLAWEIYQHNFHPSDRYSKHVAELYEHEGKEHSKWGNMAIAALSMQPNTAEAHGDMVEQVTQCCQHNCSHPDATVAEQLGRTIKVGKQRIALPSHQPTEDAKEAYEEGWRNGNSHQGELEYPHMTMQYDWNVSNARALNRPVGGEK